jgi:alpha-glucosidase (family GH31 glycosyl hydrolase)
MLNIALSGYSNIGYDIGGWDRKRAADLYAHWFAGTFNPRMWAHGQDDHEPDYLKHVRVSGLHAEMR